MLANEAADAVHQNVVNVGDVDTSMLEGVSYPRDLLAWADAVGSARLAEIIGNFARAYDEDRYRGCCCSDLCPLRHHAASAAAPEAFRSGGTGSSDPVRQN